MFFRLLATACVACVGCSENTTPTRDAGATVAPPTLGRGGAVSVDPFDPDAGLALRVNALFGSSCIGGPETSCHGSGAAGLTLDLGAGGDVINVRSTERPDLVRVRPFDPLGSYLFLKVRGDGGIDGGRMPLDSAEDPRIAPLVESWIEAGAPTP